MARQWFMPGSVVLYQGTMIDEEGTEEYFVPANGQVNEDQIVLAAGWIIPRFRRRRR